MFNIKTKVKPKFTVKVIRNNPYWQLPYWKRVYLHWIGKAPYQNQTREELNNG